jgi:hypothetical protein
MHSKVLLAVDDSKFSEAGNQAVIRRTRPQQGEVCILHAVDLPLPIPTSFGGAFRRISLERGQDPVGRVERLLGKAGFKTQGVVEEATHGLRQWITQKKVGRQPDCSRLAWAEGTRSILAWECRGIRCSSRFLLSRDCAHIVSVFVERSDEPQARAHPRTSRNRASSPGA